MDDPEGEIRWLSYREIAAARGISVASVRRTARRDKWRRMDGNDGSVRLAVPEGYLRGKEAKFASFASDPTDTPTDTPTDARSDVAIASEAFGRALDALS